MSTTLIAVDVDGTLLRSDGTVSERTSSALRRAHDYGAVIAVATGRRRRIALPVLASLTVPHFLVVSQGALTWLDDQLIGHAHLPLASAGRALEIVSSMEMGAIVYGNVRVPEALYVTAGWKANARIAAYLDRGGWDTVTELTGDSLIEDPIQMIVFDEMDKLERLNQALTGHAPPPPAADPPLQEGRREDGALWRVIFSRNQFTTGGAIEVVGPSTSKAHALGVLCRRIGSTPADVVAFGDNVNDLEMLAFAGTGVCMANGTAEAKAIADRLAPSNNDDGIAVVLEELGLA